jgi:protein-S-isoprenylcysteine O-methyltransferase Ste14
MSSIQVILRFLTLTLVIGVLLFGFAGRVDVWAFWAYLLVFAVMGPVMYAAAGHDLMRERLKPGPGGKDQLTRILAVPILLAHLALAGLDVGRFHWSDTVPTWLQVVALFGLVGGMAVWALAMHHNKYFSSVIRIQRDRGHRVVDTGPYRLVRHPGYAAALTLYVWSGLALGSWWSLLPGLLMTLLFIRRITLEDRTLEEQLEGYAEYSRRVRYRVLPGIW